MKSRYSRPIVGFIIAAVMLAPAVSAGPYQPQFHPTLNIPRVDGPVDIDGALTEAIWRQAARASGFAESDPGDNVEPPVKSEALVAYDRSNLYVALIAWDNPDEIRVSLRERDNIFRDDYFGVMLDTYGDQSWGYEIFVNPLGIQGDLRMVGGGDEDMSFDIVFESVGIVTDSGYQVEMAIPFASLRFPDTKEHVWRANFWRDRQRENRNRYSWAAQDRDEPCFMCRFGTFTGIRDIAPSSNLEILPNIVAFQSGQLSDQDNPDSDFSNTDPDAELSLNARYGISSNSSAEVTVNPDFSQIESDAGRIDVNTTYGLFFDERRPFFQEGSDLFDTWITTVYTRSINDPELAGKLTGQFGRTSIAVLSARDENSATIIPLAERSRALFADKSWVNVARVRHSLGNDSYVGATVTDRRFDKFSTSDEKYGDGSGSTYSADARLRFLQNYRLELQAVGSYTNEPELLSTTDTAAAEPSYFDYGRHTADLDGESYGGYGVYASLERSARTWNLDIDYWDYSPTYRADDGFVTRNDFREISMWTGLYFRPNQGWLVAWEPSIGIGRIWDHDRFIDINPFRYRGGSKDEWIRPNLYFRFKGQTDFNIEYLQSRERFAGQVFPGISLAIISVDSRFSEFLSGGISVNTGRTISRDRDDPDLGSGTDISAYANFKPSQRLFVQPSVDYSQLDHSDAYMDNNPGAERRIFSGYIFRTRMTYQFTREWYLRLIVQYDDFDERLDLEPLLTWRLNPFTVFYIGANSRYQYFRADNFDAVKSSKWGLSQRQFFAKLQYLFRI